MPVVITERPRRAGGESVDANDQVIGNDTRVFDVSGVTSGVEAKEQLALAPWLIVRGAKHPDYDPADAPVVVDINYSQTTAAGMYEVRVDYDSSGAGSDALLERAFDVQYEPYLYTEIRDKDVDGVPFENTAGLPFDQGLEIDVAGAILTLSRWEEDYPITKHITYAGKVCDEDGFSWTNAGGATVSVNEGQARCLGVFQGERSTASNRVRVSYRFDLRAEGFQKNVIDAGAVGWTTTGGEEDVFGATSGLFVGNASGEAAGVIRLDGTGKPLNTGFKVAPYKGTANTPVSPDNVSPSAALVNDDLSTVNAKVLTFKRCAVISFATILS